MKRLPHYLMIAILVSLLSACGWQLRGTPELPPVMSVIYVDANAPHGPFARELRRLLDSGENTRVTWEEEEATAVLRIRQASSSREVLSVNLAGRPEEIRVSYRVEFDMRRSDGKTLIEAQRLSLHRDISTDPEDALGARQEASRVARALEEEIVQSVLLRIQGLASQLDPELQKPLKPSEGED